jgi:hypothetical protein
MSRTGSEGRVRRESATRVRATRNKKAGCRNVTTSLLRQEQAGVACIHEEEEKLDAASGQRA